MSIKHLQQLEYDNRYKDNPNYPEYARYKKKYTDKTANGLTKCVVDFLNLSGHFAERISTTGRPIDQRKVTTNCIGQKQQIGSMKWIPGTTTRGSADISAVISGLSVKIEIKMKDRQSEAQKEYQYNIERAGGIYWIVRSFGEFMEKYNELINKT